MNIFRKLLKQWEGCDFCGKWCWGKCQSGTDFPD